jgi:uncharacterized protein YraI
LFKYSLTIILFVGSIVIVDIVKSTSFVYGVEAFTQPKFTTPEVKVVPIGVPAELANCISTYACCTLFSVVFK